MSRDSHLPKVVLALTAAGGFARSLHGGQQEGY